MLDAPAFEPRCTVTTLSLGRTAFCQSAVYQVVGTTVGATNRDSGFERLSRLWAGVWPEAGQWTTLSGVEGRSHLLWPAQDPDQAHEATMLAPKAHAIVSIRNTSECWSRARCVQLTLMVRVAVSPWARRMAGTPRQQTASSRLDDRTRPFRQAKVAKHIRLQFWPQSWV